MAFISKYEPKIITDLIINESKIKALTNWLDNYNINAVKYKNVKRRLKTVNIDLNEETEIVLDDNNVCSKKNKNNSNDKSCIIITGTHGIGKTSFVSTILKSKNYEINNINFEKINQIKDIDEFIDKTLKGVNIYQLIINNNYKNTKKAIVIDNIEIISSPNEKHFITNIIKQNQIEWNCPIIFICSNKHNKIINFIKKASFEIEIFPPINAQLLEVLYKIADSENLKFTDENICKMIVDYSKKDLRTLINNIQTLSEVYKNKVIGINEINDFTDSCKMKDQDLGIFDATKKLFYDYDNIDNVIRIFETEKTIIPLMIEHHYIKYLKQKNFTKIKEIADSLSKGDIIENYIYDKNYYDIRDTQAYFQCVAPSYNLTNVLNSNKNNLDTISGYFSFPPDLNKTSIKYINYSKNIVPSNKYFKNMNVNDYIYVDKVIQGLLKLGCYNKLNELINKYDLDINAIESVLKINKLNGEKFIIPNKIKKNLIKKCDNIVSDKE